MDFAVFDNPRPEVDPVLAARIVADHYDLEGTAEPLAGERDRSFKITARSGTFVLKVGNNADRPDALEAQSSAIEWAIDRDPGLPLAKVIRTPSGTPTGVHEGHTLQLTEFVPGSPPPQTDAPPALRRNLGALAARLSRALRGFDHPALHRSFPWTLTQLPELLPLLDHVAEYRRPLVEATLHRFSERVGPALGQFHDQALHGDINTDNIVVDDEAGELVAGLFDFGDMSHGPRVVESAITAAYQCLGSDPTAAMRQVVSAFHLEDPLDLDEIELIPDLVAARCAQSLLMSARHVATRADNAEYATGDDDLMWATLEALDLLDYEAIADEITSACGLHRPKRRSLEQALALRQQRLGPSLSLSYDQPVHLERGDGVWLIDTDGKRLLDAYNNVPHVGHSHPEVALALASQARTLNTNTRYLVDGVAEYADRLADLMPDPLSVVLFVNSGSEANDLAYRIARAVTGARGVITTENAYHGSTLATAVMSPEEPDWTDLEPWAARVAGTEMLAGPAAADRVSTDLHAAQRQLAERGETPAMAIFDTVFSSEGIFAIPDGALKAARAWAGETGALLVADEVQAGFGRVGPAFWGFATDDVVPDIVTLGKPMGNGHPMGAVVTTRAIAGEFASESHFFSTFAGSPVAAAVGMAVMDVIEREELAANAERVGAYLKQQIEALAHPDIVEVRGPGLFVGVEMESHRLATRTVNDMRRNGVLIGATGPSGNVLKIRPPLVVRPHHADLVVDALRRSLARS